MKSFGSTGSPIQHEDKIIPVHTDKRQSKERLDFLLRINNMSNVFESTGDSLYPEETDRSVSTKKCLEELQRTSPNLHRIVMHNPYQCSVYMNIIPKYKHLPPLTCSESKPESKL